MRIKITQKHNYKTISNNCDTKTNNVIKFNNNNTLWEEGKLPITFKRQINMARLIKIIN